MRSAPHRAPLPPCLPPLPTPPWVQFLRPEAKATLTRERPAPGAPGTSASKSSFLGWGWLLLPPGLRLWREGEQVGGGGGPREGRPPRLHLPPPQQAAPGARAQPQPAEGPGPPPHSAAIPASRPGCGRVPVPGIWAEWMRRLAVTSPLQLIFAIPTPEGPGTTRSQQSCPQDLRHAGAVLPLQSPLPTKGAAREE